MPLKQSEILSRSDFDQAVVHLRLNISDVAKATGIPRTYLSEFRNGDRRLRPEHLAKLRDFFEGKGVEFTPGPTADAKPTDPASTPISPHPRLRAVHGVRCYFPIADSVPNEVVARTMDLMESNDARLGVLLKQTVERDDGLFASGDLTEDTRAALQEAGSLLAENYLLFRMLRGWPAFGVRPSGDTPETLRDTLFAVYRPRLEEAGLIEPHESQHDAEQHPDASEQGDEDIPEPEGSHVPWASSAAKGEA